MLKKYKGFGILEDDRDFIQGDVWKVRDELISFPKSDRVKGKRHIHPCRLVLITQNCKENSDKFYPVIQVVPLTTKTEFQQNYDVLLKKNIDIFDTDKDECMAEIQLEQPILKKDLYEKVGYISQDKIYEIIALKAELMGLNLDEEN